MTKPLVIYHNDCTDGFAAAFVAYLTLGDDAEYKAFQYGKQQRPSVSEVQRMVAGRRVFILDFSFSTEVMNLIVEYAEHTVWLDHHKSAILDHQGEYSKGRSVQTVGVKSITWLDDCRSGAVLAWDYFNPNKPRPLFVDLIDDRDRWVFAYGDASRAFHLALNSRASYWTFELWKNLFYDNSRTENQSTNVLIKDEGLILLNYQQELVTKVLKTKQLVKVSTQGLLDLPFVVHEGYAANSAVLQSEVGERLAIESGTFGLVWYLADNGRIRCSFRSQDGYDVSAIAKAFGGGGHEEAAGCEVDVETFLSWHKV